MKTNWEKEKLKLRKAGIMPIDDLPNIVVSYLKDNIGDTKHNAHLAGMIKKEYKYDTWPGYIEDFVLRQTHDSFFDSWCDKHEVLSSGRPFFIKNMWINIQEKYEYNPIHNHDGVFSFIIFLQIPYDLKEEEKVFPPNSTGISTASKLCFLTYDSMGDMMPLPLDVDKSFEGKMLMFPSKMLHLVYPFYTSDDYRMTVSGNVSFWVEN